MALIGKSVGWFFSRSRDAIAMRLSGWGVTPNMLTILGLMLTIGVGVSLGFGVATECWGYYALALLGLYWCAACDMLDGAIARLCNKSSSFGGVLDSTVDRLSDFALFGGVAMGFLCRPQPNLTFALLSMLAFLWAFEISYIRARALGAEVDVRVGFWQRGERFAAVVFAALAGNPGALALQQGISPAFTVWRRLDYVRRQLGGLSVVDDVYRDGRWRHKIQPWLYPRMSWPYDLIVLANIAWLLFTPIDPEQLDFIGHWIRSS